MSTRIGESKYSFGAKWAPGLEGRGYTQVSNFFLENYHRLQPYALTHGEAMFVVHLMQHRWGEDAPFPSYGTLAQRMGVSVKTVRRYAQSLQAKGYLYRTRRVGTSNLFQLDALMTALVRLMRGGTGGPNGRRREP